MYEDKLGQAWQSRFVGLLRFISSKPSSRLCVGIPFTQTHKFVKQVHKMPGEKVDNIHGYIYGFSTIFFGVLAGIVIYGWSVWA